MLKRVSLRSVSIDEEVQNWLNDFRDKMLIIQDQQIPYSTAFNLIAKLGIWIITNPDKLTDEQKDIILKHIEEATKYKPPHTIFQWSDKYAQCMIPKLLDGSIKEPYELDKSEVWYGKVSCSLS